jgi:hypothetical protein
VSPLHGATHTCNGDTLIKIDMLKITVLPKKRKKLKMLGTARRTLPNIACPKIGTAEK